MNKTFKNNPNRKEQYKSAISQFIRSEFTWDKTVFCVYLTDNYTSTLQTSKQNVSKLVASMVGAIKGTRYLSISKTPNLHLLYFFVHSKRCASFSRLVNRHWKGSVSISESYSTDTAIKFYEEAVEIFEKTDPNIQGRYKSTILQFSRKRK
jgi:hypothetical protein